MEKTISHKVISIWVVIVLLLPLSIQFVHAFENHELSNCNEQYIQHLHEKHIECKSNHFLLNTNASFQSEVFKLYSPTYAITKPLFFTYESKEIHLFSKSSRAPPTVII